MTPEDIQKQFATGSFKRDPGLVRAELVDALQQFAEIFRQKASMEFSRAERVEAMANKIAAGGAADQADIQAGQDYEKAYGLLEMQFTEVKLRCQRLLIEHGGN